MSSPAEQVTYLLACIKHTTNGKIDFDALATELNLTKGAAYKRYTRLKARAQESDFSTGGNSMPSGGRGGSSGSGSGSGGHNDGEDASGAPPTPDQTPKAKRVRARPKAVPEAVPEAAATKLDTTTKETAPAAKRKRADMKSEDTDPHDTDPVDGNDADNSPSVGRPPKRQKAKLASMAIKQELAAEVKEEFHDRLEQDRRLQEQTLADAGYDSGEDDGKNNKSSAVPASGTFRFVAEEIEIDLSSCKSAAQVKAEESHSTMAFHVVEDEM